jgi:hypothetical protein
VTTDTLPASLRPNFLGIGAAKAGTTRFAALLSRHPDIFMPPQKELNCLHYSDLDARLEEYADYFRGAEQARVRCDFSVRYLASPLAPQAAARLLPDAKIMAILRNPVDQVQSHYWHLRRQNFHQRRPLANPPALFEALERFPDLLLEPARYAKHLQRWLDCFPQSAVLLIDHALATHSPGEALDSVWRFLGLDADASGVDMSPASQQSRRGVHPRNDLLGRIYPHVYTALTRGPYQSLKNVVGVQAAESLKRRLRLREVAEAVFFKPGYPPLDHEGRCRLFEMFEHDVRALGALTEIDVEAWRPQ